MLFQSTQSIGSLAAKKNLAHRMHLSEEMDDSSDRASFREEPA